MTRSAVLSARTPSTDPSPSERVVWDRVRWVPVRVTPAGAGGGAGPVTGRSSVADTVASRRPEELPSPARRPVPDSRARCRPGRSTTWSMRQRFPVRSGLSGGAPAAGGKISARPRRPSSALGRPSTCCTEVSWNWRSRRTT